MRELVDWYHNSFNEFDNVSILIIFKCNNNHIFKLVFIFRYTFFDLVNFNLNNASDKFFWLKEI
jgi:hypothetical protein